MLKVECNDLVAKVRIVGSWEEIDRDRQKLCSLVPRKHRQWDGRQFIIYFPELYSNIPAIKAALADQERQIAFWRNDGR
jgi:hypothetical protein